MAHYTYLDHLIPPVSAVAQDWQELTAGVLLAGALVVVGKKLTGRIKNREGVKKEIVPAEKLSLFGFFDVFIETFIKYHDSVLGKEHRRHVPFTGALFLFIFFSNLLGLVPGMPAVTTSIWVNVGMAFCVLIYFNYYGIKTQGLTSYFKHFLGPLSLPVAILFLTVPLMLMIEVVSVLFLRPFVLNLRLYWNISADHIVLGTFTELLPPFAAFPFYAVGMFVSFMQAFVFTTLTMIYILLAVQHHEEEH